MEGRYVRSLRLFENLHKPSKWPIPSVSKLIKFLPLLVARYSLFQGRALSALLPSTREDTVIMTVRLKSYFPAGGFNVTTGDGNRDPTGPVNSSFVPSS